MLKLNSDYIISLCRRFSRYLFWESVNLFSNQNNERNQCF